VAKLSDDRSARNRVERLQAAFTEGFEFPDLKEARELVSGGAPH
jgi:hypothetical protein